MVLKFNGCQLSLLLKIFFLLPYVLLTDIIFFISKSTLITSIQNLFQELCAF